MPVNVMRKSSIPCMAVNVIKEAACALVRHTQSTMGAVPRRISSTDECMLTQRTNYNKGVSFEATLSNI